VAAGDLLDQLIGTVGFLPGANTREDGGIEVALMGEDSIQAGDQLLLGTGCPIASRHRRATLGWPEAQLA